MIPKMLSVIPEVFTRRRYSANWCFTVYSIRILKKIQNNSFLFWVIIHKFWTRLWYTQLQKPNWIPAAIISWGFYETLLFLLLSSQIHKKKLLTTQFHRKCDRSSRENEQQYSPWIVHSMEFCDRLPWDLRTCRKNRHFFLKRIPITKIECEKKLFHTIVETLMHILY